MNFLILLIVIWGAFLGGWLLVSNFFKKADAKQIQSRLAGKDKAKSERKAKSGPALINLEDPNQSRILKMLKRFDVGPRLEKLIEQSGMKMKVSALVNLSLFLFLGGFWLGWNFLGPWRNFGFLVGLALGVLPVMWVDRAKKARLHKFEEQFPESLEFVARSLRAGHAFSVSLEMIHREFQEPLSGEFRRTFEEHNLGMPLELALQKFAERVPLLDVHFFVSAVMLQKRTGGNLAEILDKLAYVIRERFKLRGKIRAISAHGKYTGIALTCIPIGVAGLMFLTNRDYVTFFVTDEIGNYMALAAIGLQIIGYLVIQKIVTIEI